MPKRRLISARLAVSRFTPIRWVIKRLMPRIRFSTQATRMTGWQYRAGLAMVQPGDIILTVDYARLGAKLTPGLSSHAAICVSKSSDTAYCAEMTALGFGIVEWFDICHHADRVFICRCTEWDDDYIESVLEKVMEYCRVKTQYDFDFCHGDDRLYCSELIHVSDVEGRLGATPTRLFLTGEEVVTPDDLRTAKNVNTMFDSDFRTVIRSV